jgi:hypothetical protein
VAADPTRRRVLTASALAVLAAAGAAGCAPGQPWPWATPPHPSPDVGVLRNVIAAEKAMVSRYTAVISARPPLAGMLAPLLRQHEAHLAQLRERLLVPAGAAASASPPAARRHPPRVPAGRAAALDYLRAAESDQAAFLVRELAALASPALAQLFASIGASEATHAALLRPARPSR